MHATPVTRIPPARRPVSTTAEQRRRRHLSVYHRALRSAKTPEQRTAVAARYRKLFAVEKPAVVDVSSPTLADTIYLPLSERSAVRLAS